MKKTISIRNILLFVFYFVLFEELFISFFDKLSVIRYIPDVLLIICFLFSIKGKANEKYLKMMIPVIIYFLITLFSAIFNSVNALLYVWALRNSFRFFIYYYLCSKYIQKDDVLKIIKRIPKIYVINFIMILIEFFILGYRRDTLGGIFGFQPGCNGALNIFLVAVTCMVMSNLLSKDKTKNSYTGLLFIVFNIIISAMAELKIYYIELIVIFILFTLLNKFSIKKLVYVIAGILILTLGSRLMINIFPEQAKFFTDFDSLVEYYNYTGSEMNYLIGRGTFYDQINRMFFKDNTKYRLLGIGFGNAEMSSISGRLTTNFYRRYGYLQYRNLSSSMIYLETGILGLISYVFIFIAMLIQTIKNKSKDIMVNKYKMFNKLFLVILIINIFYNSTSRRDIAFVSFILLAFFNVLANKKEETTNE